MAAIAARWRIAGDSLRPGMRSILHPNQVRELDEELGIEVTAYSSFMNLRHEYNDRIVTIEFFIVSNWNSRPVGREGQRLRWVPRRRLDAVKLLPADIPIVTALQQIDS